MCVKPASCQSWFQLVEDRAHTYSISPLLCEDSPGTGPTTSPNTHLLDALHARLHASLAGGLNRHRCVTAESRIRRTCKVVHTVDVQYFIYTSEKSSARLTVYEPVVSGRYESYQVSWEMVLHFRPFAGSVSRLSITSLKLRNVKLRFVSSSRIMCMFMVIFQIFRKHIIHSWWDR